MQCNLRNLLFCLRSRPSPTLHPLQRTSRRPCIFHPGRSDRHSAFASFIQSSRWRDHRVPIGARGKGVKRVAGLPHEHVEILAGDLWRDGRRQTKDLDSFLRSAILVDALHEDSHPMPKWVAHRENQRPRTVSDLTSEEWYRFVPDPSFPETVPQSITDDYWMNQGERLHPMPYRILGSSWKWSLFRQRLRSTLNWPWLSSLIVSTADRSSIRSSCVA